jgi:hypothetical protein
VTTDAQIVALCLTIEACTEYLVAHLPDANVDRVEEQHTLGRLVASALSGLTAQPAPDANARLDAMEDRFTRLTRALYGCDQNPHDIVEAMIDALEVQG